MNNTIARALSFFRRQKQPKEPSRPTEGYWYSGVRDDYSVDANIRRSLTPEKLGNLINDANQGSTASQYELFEVVEQDDQVTSVLAKRRRAVVSRKLLIEPPMDDDGSSEYKKALEMSDFCNEIVFGRWGIGGIKGLSSSLYDLTDAIAKGFALSQIVWKYDGGRYLPSAIERWPQRECQIGDPASIYQQDQDTVRIITDAEAWRGEDLQKYQWILHIQKQWSQPLARAALMRSIVWFYLFKRASWRDWMIFSEKFGMPTRMGKYHPGANDTEKAALWNAVKSLGTDAACIVPEQSTIELIETRAGVGTSSLPFPDLIIRCNEAISTAVLGNPMTTAPGDKGARSLGEVYERGEDELTKSDCSNLAETIRQQLLAPLVGFNFGWDYPVPRVQFSTEQAVDLDKLSQRDDRLVKMKLPIAKSYFYETYGIPQPSEDDDLLEAPAPPPQFGGEPPPENTDEDDEPSDGNDDEQEAAVDEESDDKDEQMKELSNIISDAMLVAAEKKKIREWLLSQSK